MLFCTINEFTAYGSLNGYNVKGYKACPISESYTYFHQLRFRNKIVYLMHQKFLKPIHPYRRLRKAFNKRMSMKSLSNLQLLMKFINDKNALLLSLGKIKKGSVERNSWKKYWYYLIFHIDLSSK